MKITFYAKISKSGDYLIIRVPRAVKPMLEDLYQKEVKVTVWVGESEG